MSQNEQKKDRDTYRTGSTNPPKNYQGTIAVLLILVTVLCSIVTVLGMMNIRLWNTLQSEKEQELDDSAKEQIAMAQYADTSMSEEESISVLGMTCQQMSQVYRSYNGWPDGLYVSQVEPGSAAENAHIRPGDILVAMNDSPIALREELEQTVQELSSGDQLKLRVYREESQIDILLTVD